jgi:hypothetical protein
VSPSGAQSVLTQAFINHQPSVMQLRVAARAPSTHTLQEHRKLFALFEERSAQQVRALLERMKSTKTWNGNLQTFREFYSCQAGDSAWALLNEAAAAAWFMCICIVRSFQAWIPRILAHAPENQQECPE